MSPTTKSAHLTLMAERYQKASRKKKIKNP